MIYVGDISSNIWEPISISQTMLFWKPIWVRQQSYAVVKQAPPCRRLKVASWYNVLSQRYSP